MRALKLLSPLIALFLILAGGFLFWRYYDFQSASDEELGAFMQKNAPEQKTLDFARAFPAARSAFDFSNTHMEVPQEWWYFNAHLIDGSRRRYTFMIAMLKNGHVFGSLASLDKKRHQPLATQDLVDVDPNNRLIKVDWCSLFQPDPDKLEYEFTFEHDIGSLYLKMAANKLPLPVGGEGYVAMGEAGKSYYYSLTNMDVSGFGRIGGKKVRLSGRAWMDRQWGQWRDRDFDQWHWFSIQLTNNIEIMIFDFRKNGKTITPLCDVVLADGSFLHDQRFKIKVLGYWTSPETNKIWSSGWQIEIPELDAHLTVIPDMKNQEVTDALWEGGCRVTGMYGGHNVWGRAFYEARHRTW